MSTVAVPQSTAEVIAGKIPFWNRIQDVGYSYVGGQWAVGFWSGLYVLITQAHYWGKSFKWTWDHLNVLWHFKAIPWIGNWLYDNYDVGRHIFLRDAPEAILAYSVVAMIITWLALKKYQPSLIRKLLMRLHLAGPPQRKIPLIQKAIVKAGMPSIYQEDMGRHPDTSTLQYVFLIPSMLLAALPGEIVISAVIFGGIAFAHHHGYYSPWLEPTSPWVSVIIGLVGGKAFGHVPAVKAGFDAQRKYGIGKRLAVNYAADDILVGFHEEPLTKTSQDQARNKLTAMRRADPSLLYPSSYRLLYDRLLAQRVPVRKYGLPSAVMFTLSVLLFVIIGAWGVYLRKYGIGHGFWMPW